jgi:hypothetical protein
MAADVSAMSINAMPMAVRWRTNLTPNSGRKLQTKKIDLGIISQISRTAKAGVKGRSITLD